MTKTAHHTSPAPANDDVPPAPQDAAFAFALAPMAPLVEMARTQWQAQQALMASQAQWSMLCARTLTDAWRLAMRRQWDAAFGLTGAQSEADANALSDDSRALQAAADSARTAGQNLVAAQTEALERVRRSA